MDFYYLHFLEEIELTLALKRGAGVSVCMYVKMYSFSGYGYPQ